MCVGTTWESVTRYFSMAARNCSASNRFIVTMVPPSRCTADVQPEGAAWYSGAGHKSGDGDAVQQPRGVGGRQHDLRAAVVDDVSRLLGGQMPVDRRDIQPR